MRIAAGILVAAGLAMAALAVAAPPGALLADRVGASPVMGSSQLVTLVTPLGDNRQQLLLVDPELHVMSIYHLEASGEITLRSVPQLSLGPTDGAVQRHQPAAAGDSLAIATTIKHATRTASRSGMACPRDAWGVRRGRGLHRPVPGVLDGPQVL